MTKTSSSSESGGRSVLDSMNSLSMQQFELDLELVHRILLTDPNDLNSLTAASSHQPEETFGAFQHRILLSGRDPSSILKRAYHDNLLESLERSQSLAPVKRLILELHSEIRALVPNRQDLHSLLNDAFDLPDVSQVETFYEILVLAARALVQLESPARTQSTKDWIRTVEDRGDDDNSSSAPVSPPSSTILISIFYLLYKTELCQQDKQSFYLTNVLAPRLLNSDEGIDFERLAFRDRFGSDPPPITKEWIQTLLTKTSSEQMEEMVNSRASRQAWIRVGWIESILFQSDQPIALPEIFAVDLSNLQTIRQVTRTAAAGCALALSICTILGINPENVLNDESAGEDLVNAMGNHRHASLESYEQSVQQASLALASKWKGEGLNGQEQENIRGRTKSVLQGNDPVIKLLDGRMKEIFASVARQQENTPAMMRAGRATNGASVSPNGGYDTDRKFMDTAKQSFRERGLAFYSTSLSEAVSMAVKIADLAWTIHADSFLEKLILEACQN